MPLLVQAHAIEKARTTALVNLSAGAATANKCSPISGSSFWLHLSRGTLYGRNSDCTKSGE